MRGFLFVLLVLAYATTTYAAPPQTITYQGYLTTSAGVPVSGNVSITFSLYAAPDAMKPLWAESHAVVPVSAGRYSATLGNFAPLALPFDQQYWIGVKVGTDAEMTPRQALTSVPYAFRSASVSYPSARTGYLNVNANAFFPADSGNRYSGLPGGNYRYLVSGPDGSHLAAGVSLPEGVTMTDLTCWVYDNAPAGTVTVGLVDGISNSWRCDPTDSSGAAPAVQEIAAPCFASVVANTTNSYYLRFIVSSVAQCGENCRIYGCRIAYTYTEEGR
jgi:hypothetical protein